MASRLATFPLILTALVALAVLAAALPTKNVLAQQPPAGFIEMRDACRGVSPAIARGTCGSYGYLWDVNNRDYNNVQRQYELFRLIPTPQLERDLRLAQSAAQQQKNPQDPAARKAFDEAFRERFKSPPNKCKFDGSWTEFGEAFFSLDCWLKLISAGVVSVIAFVGVYTVTLSAAFFNYLIGFTIVDFGNTYLIIKKAVEDGWVLIRDLANIGIIGVFTYVAISMIIGNTTYGTKQMVARVLIVAVLINFSLLFTKIVIDMSHFVATQIYSATVERSSATCTNKPCVAEQFLKFAGVSGAFDTYGKLRQQQADNTEFGSLSTLMYGFLLFIYLLAVTIVLLYGAYLLFFRAFVLIALLLMSAWAFATWLLPSLHNSPYGWEGWWSQLLNNALFAPLFFVTLWLALNVSEAYSRTAGQALGTLGALATAPVQNIGALTEFIFVLGMLAASLYIANSFSNKLAASATAKLTSATLVGTTGYGLSKLTDWRQRANYRKAQKTEKEIEKVHQNPNLTPLQKDTKIKQLEQQRARQVAASKRDLNLFNKKPVQDLMKGLVGTSGVVTGKIGEGKNYEQKVKAEAKAQEERYANALPTSKDKEKLHEEAAKQVSEEVKKSPEQKALTQARLESVQKLEQEKARLASKEQPLQERAQQAQNAFDREKMRIGDALSEARKEIQETAKRLAENPDSPESEALKTRLGALQANYSATEKQFSDELAGHESALSKTKMEIDTEKQALQQAVKAAEAAVGEATKREGALVADAVAARAKQVETELKTYSDTVRDRITQDVGKDVGSAVLKSLEGKEKKKKNQERYQALFGDEAAEAKASTQADGKK